MKRWLLWITILLWCGIGAWVLNHTLALTGSVTLRWPNPVHPTAHFSWHQAPVLQGRQVHITADATNRFAVTLPRGFKTGQARLSFTTSDSSPIRFSAAARSGQKITITTTASPAILSFDWTSLQFRGRTADFQITNLGSASVSVNSITVYAK